ncbi:Putative ubiquinone biosynthesis monooxygenase [Chamberlinius hualienensis]
MFKTSFSRILQVQQCSYYVLSNTFKRAFASEGSNAIDGHYDIIITGCGMVGSSAAASLALSPKLSNKRILLIESGPLRNYSFKDVYSNRVSAISPSTKQFMQKVGAWEYIENARYHTIKRMQVWDGCSDAVISFTGLKENDDVVAYTVENNLIVQAFLSVVQKFKDQVTLLNATRINEYELPSTGLTDDKVKVKLLNGQTITADLLIGADGWRSTVRDCMDTKYLNWSYDQMAVVATLHLEDAAKELSNCVAWQRFLPKSTIALLPLNNKSSSLVWSTSLPHAKELLMMSDQDFVKSVNDALWRKDLKIPAVTSLLSTYSRLLNSFGPKTRSSFQLPPYVGDVDPKSRSGFVLGFGHASNYVGNRVALIGDAAHRVHPHAGQGVNLGFADVECLCQTLEEAVSCGADIGSLLYLMQYETHRQRRIAILMAGIDGIHRLYKTSFTPLVLLRSLGLQSVNAVDSFKNHLMRSTVQ